MFLSLRPCAERSDAGPSLRWSIFDIVYQATPNRHKTPDRPLTPGTAPVNFLYMGLFLRFKKT